MKVKIMMSEFLLLRYCWVLSLFTTAWVLSMRIHLINSVW